MTPEENKHLFELEEHHWWFKGMRRITSALLDRFVSTRPLRVLDAGCGTGLTMSWLRRYGSDSRIYGLDASSDALHYCRRRGERLLVQASLAETPLPSSFFDLVISLDVLDEFSLAEAPHAFAELARLLKEGGLLLVRVPAFQFLYSRHDRAIHTVHRYTRRELAEQLTRQGLIVERITYANTLLFPVAALWRWLTASGTEHLRSDVRPLPKPIGWLSSVLEWLLALEAACLRYLPWNLPFGLSAIAVAKKIRSSSPGVSGRRSASSHES